MACIGCVKGHVIQSMRAVRTCVVMRMMKQHALIAGRRGGLPWLTKG